MFRFEENVWCLDHDVFVAYVESPWSSVNFSRLIDSEVELCVHRSIFTVGIISIAFTVWSIPKDDSMPEVAQFHQCCSTCNRLPIRDSGRGSGHASVVATIAGCMSPECEGYM